MSQRPNMFKPYLETAAGPPKASSTASKDAAFTAAETSVRQLIVNTKYKTALDRAKEIHKSYSSGDSESLLIDAYMARIHGLIEQNLAVEANSLLDLVRERYPVAAERLASLAASAAARAGKLGELLEPLNNPSLPADRRAAIELALQEQVTDLATLAECPVLSAEHPLRQAAASLRQAFAAVTTGPVADEALALPEVSRRSPLAPWKFLVGAIASFYRREDETCRRHLDAIKPESAAARLVPAVRAMLDGTAAQTLSPGSAELVSRVTADALPLKHAIERLDREFESADSETQILNAIRVAVQECRRIAPGHLDRLQQHISVRALLEYLDPKKVRAAMGGSWRHDAYFTRLLAKGFAQSRDPAEALLACRAWNEFRRSAVEEGWFAANGVEAATLYLHTARLLGDVPKEMIRSFEKATLAESKQSAGEFFFLYPEKLYERACALDPHSEAFSQWMDWAKRNGEFEAERVAEAWNKVRPQDIEPLLYLIHALEKRGAFATALQYLVKAERIDGINPEVRRARLRLLAGNTMRHIQQKKHALAGKAVDEISALSQAQQGDRPAFTEALRYVAASARGDTTKAGTHRAELERLIGSRVAAALLIFAVATTCKRGALESLEPVRKVEKAELATLPAILVRLVALAKDVQFNLHLPSDWVAEAAKQFPKVRQSLDISQLRILGEAALRVANPEFAYAVSAAGLERNGPAAAEFLLLRAQCLPERSFERLMVCAAAAAALAQDHRDMDLAGRAIDFLRDPSREGPIELTLAEADEVLRKEKTEPIYPKGSRTGPKYPSLSRGDLCPCPDCRQRRGEKVDPSEFYPDGDFEDEGDIFDEALSAGIEIPTDMPPEIAKILLEETKRAVLSGESLEDIIARLSGEALLPKVQRKKGRRK